VNDQENKKTVRILIRENMKQKETYQENFNLGNSLTEQSSFFNDFLISRLIFTAAC